MRANRSLHAAFALKKGYKMGKFLMAVSTLAASSLAVAGANLGTSVGVPTGGPLGQIMGFTVGAALPGGGLLIVAAISLAVGVRIVRRKQSRNDNEPRS